MPMQVLRSAIIGSILVICASAAPARPLVIGYAPAFRPLAESIGRGDAGRYTHINIAFANPDASGLMVDGGKLTCMPRADRTMMRLEALKGAVAALKEKGVKVSVSIGGGVIPACSGDWRVLLAPSRRAAMVANLLDLVDTLELDGLDVDIEGALLTEIDKAGDFTPFIAALSAGMKQRGKLLSCATASYDGGMIPIDSIPYFDLVNVMSYDAIGPSWGRAGAEHSTYEAAQRDLELWRARGVSKERLVLGLPFYGYGFGEYRPNWAYRDLRSTHGAAALKADVIGRACPGCDYITFNSPSTIRRKARLAAAEAAGVMVWEMSQDSADALLMGAIEAGFGDAAPRPDGNAPTFRQNRHCPRRDCAR